MSDAEKKPAVFLDRDGTINIDKDYLYKVEDFEFVTGAPEAIRALKDSGYLVIVVTNQSGIARGYYNLNDVSALHEYVQKELRQYKTSIDAFYVCPHHPEKGQGEFRVECDCRKGAPGMLLQAAKEYDVDLSKSFMIGDKMADVEAGENAGCHPIMVLTGYGSMESKKIRNDRVALCADLSEAVKLILSGK